MLVIKAFYNEFKTKGLYGVKRLIIKKYFTHKPIQKFKMYKKHFENKNGIEIGGLSNIFCLEVPLYKVIKNLDGCNFSGNTVWEGTINEGITYNFYESKTGYQYVCEASNLSEIPDEKYDFLISSHCLEHCANALKTVEEWCRVVKKNGAILLVLPDKRFTFDHKRPVTEFKHLLDDYKNNVNEHDLTHLNEILNLHDLDKDHSAGTIEQFKNRSLDNFNNRCLHQHIFDFDLLQQVFKFYNIETLDVTFAKPYHQIILGIKK